MDDRVYVHHCSFLSLPEEILRLLLQHHLLDIPDLFRVGRVCRTLRKVANEIWTLIAKKRWTNWGPFSNTVTNAEWKDLCKARYELEHRLMQAYGCLSEEYINRNVCDISISKWIPEHFNRQLLNLVLFSDIQQSHDSANLTYQHYGVQVFEFMHRKTALNSLEATLLKPEDSSQLETCAALFAAYFNPYEDNIVEWVVSTLDSLAEDVAKHLMKQELNLEGGQCLALPEPPYLPRVIGMDGMKVCKAISHVLYTMRGFKGNDNDYYNISNSFIHEVLKTKRGIPITLCVVYAGVARRLGVTLEAVTFPQHFLLRLSCSSPAVGSNASTSPIDDANWYIDAFNGGSLITARGALELIGGVRLVRSSPNLSIFKTAGAMQVITRMGMNIQFGVGGPDNDNFSSCRDFNTKTNLWSASYSTAMLLFMLDWFLLVYKNSRVRVTIDFIKVVVRKCVLEDLHLDKVVAVMKVLQQSGPRAVYDVRPDELHGPPTPLAVKRRDPTVLYHVGMIIHHKRYKYCGVITGWDKKCEMSMEWIVQMGVNELPSGSLQPFYNILVQDHTSRYVAQENIQIPVFEECQTILDFDVGKFFTSFRKDHYEPNAVLRAAYPDDKY